MRLARLKIRMPGNWISELCSQCDLSIRVLKCVPNGASGGMSLLRIDASKAISMNDIENKIRAIIPTCEIRLSQTGPGRILGTINNKKCNVCNIVTSSGCFLDNASSDIDGTIIWTIIAPNSKSLQRLVEAIKNLGCDVAIDKITSIKTERELTEAQEKVMWLAYNLGYFDIPRRINLAKLAKDLEISKATLDIMLRRAQKKIIAQHISRMGEKSSRIG